MQVDEYERIPWTELVTLVPRDGNTRKHFDFRKGFAATLFYSGLSHEIRQKVKLISVYSNDHTSQRSRMSKFNFSKAYHALLQEGCSNVRFAWHGGSRTEVARILVNGFQDFSRPTEFGRGLNLHAQSNHSVLSSFHDSEGVSYVLLCKVLTGKTELVKPNSTQSLPISEDYHTGVDNTENPSKYIVWWPHMNSHVLPLFLVSFKYEDSVPPKPHILKAASKGLTPLSSSYRLLYPAEWLRAAFLICMRVMET